MQGQAFLWSALFESTMMKRAQQWIKLALRRAHYESAQKERGRHQSKTRGTVTGCSVSAACAPVSQEGCPRSAVLVRRAGWSWPRVTSRDLELMSLPATYLQAD